MGNPVPVLTYQVETLSKHLESYSLPIYLHGIFCLKIYIYGFGMQQVDHINIFPREPPSPLFG